MIRMIDLITFSNILSFFLFCIFFNLSFIKEYEENFDNFSDFFKIDKI